MEIIMLGVIILLPVIYVVTVYNTLISLKNHIREAWGNIDTELKRRYELIPNLVSTVKGYARHEKEVFERIIKFRNQCKENNGPVHLQAAGEQQLVGSMKKLFAVVEKYPKLKADEHFLKLQRELVNTEDRIQAARRFYNGNVRDYKNKSEAFPNNIIASMFNFEGQDFFDVEQSVRKEPSLTNKF